MKARFCHWLAMAAIFVSAQAGAEAPKLVKHGTATQLDSAWEGTFDTAGKWVPGRLLNGDQTHQGRHIRLAPGAFQIQRVKLYRYR